MTPPTPKTTPAQLAANDTGGVNIYLAAPQNSQAISVSNIWTMAGWTIQFARLGPSQQLDLDQARGIVYVKIILGDLANIARDRFADFMQVRSIETSQDMVKAGAHGALLAIMTETPDAPANIHSMDQLTVTGALQEAFSFTRVDQIEMFKKFKIFHGVDAHLMPGFHLLDDDGSEIVYIHFWTAGMGVDMSAHDHPAAPTDAVPTFTETHFVLNNGTGSGAMYECVDNNLKDRRYMPIQRGQEHGPFWLADPDTGMPVLRENGSVDYGLHGWQAGNDDAKGQAYDLVAAFELSPEYSKI